MFAITAEPIAPPLLKPSPRTGAIVSFEGRVRDLNEGLTVERLEYEAFAPLAVAEAETILAEARQRFAVLDVACVHRIGTLDIGDVAIRVEASGVHREESFRACEYVVEQVKARVPIWKKEHYAGADPVWLGTEPARGAGVSPAGLQTVAGSDATDGLQPALEEAFYARQMRLPEVGPEGQQRLRQAKVLVVGAGGLGSPALMYLAAAGVGTIGICDYDSLEISNVHRQILYAAVDAGKPKADLAAGRLSALNPHIRVEVHREPLNETNAASLIGRYDLVVDGTDNFRTKYLINDAAMAAGKPAIFASVYQYEGQVLVVDPHHDGGCLRCLWPTPPDPDCVGSCAVVGVLGAVPGVLGSLQAMEALKLLLRLPGSTARTHLVLLDLLSLTLQSVPRQQSPKCSICGGGPTVEMPPWETTAHELVREGVGRFVVVDVREEWEQPDLPVEHVRMPMSRFDPRKLPDQPVLLVCAHGVRSATVAHQMHEAGDRRFRSLAGGFAALRFALNSSQT